MNRNEVYYSNDGINWQSEDVFIKECDNPFVAMTNENGEFANVIISKEHMEILRDLLCNR